MLVVALSSDQVNNRAGTSPVALGTTSSCENGAALLLLIALATAEARLWTGEGDVPKSDAVLLLMALSTTEEKLWIRDSPEIYAVSLFIALSTAQLKLFASTVISAMSVLSAISESI